MDRKACRRGRRISRRHEHSVAQQHLRNILAALDAPTLGLPEAFIHANDGFNETGDISDGNKDFQQQWMDRYIAWVIKHAS